MGGSESTARGSLEHVAMFFYFSKYPLHKLFSFFILLAYFFVECHDKTSL